MSERSQSPQPSKTAPTLLAFIEHVRAISAAFFDSYMIIDGDFNIVDGNSQFHKMIPHGASRSVVGKKCYEVLQWSICEESCIAKQSWQANGPIQLEHVSGHLPGEMQPRHVVLKCLPVFDESGRQVGAMELQRDVSAEVGLQVRHQQLLETEKAERAKQRFQVDLRSKELIEANERLLNAYKELASLRKKDIS